MGVGDRFPTWGFDRNFSIQVVGPHYGICRDITTRTANYLQENELPDTEAVCLGSGITYSNKSDSDVDCSVFLLLNPDHSDKTQAEDVNSNVLDGIKQWLLSRPTEARKTILVFEDTNEKLSGEFSGDPLLQDLIPKVNEFYFEVNEVQSMRETILSQCKNYS